MADLVLPGDVKTFLSLARNSVGLMAANEFDASVTQEMNGKITSPIEQLFFIAIKAFGRAVGVSVSPTSFEDERRRQLGVYLDAQAKIGKYSVDFLLTSTNGFRSTQALPLIVELDGHAFHDKNKAQRSYEKSRDRFFVKQGYRVIHYTGSDVVKNPYLIAHEVISMFIEGIDEFDESDPLSLS